LFILFLKVQSCFIIIIFDFEVKYLLSETHKVFILFLKVQSCFIIIIFDFNFFKLLLYYIHTFK